MLKSYLLTALRNLRRHKYYTLSSTLGLALGVASALLILMLVQYHRRFDGWHHHADRIYRIVSWEKRPDGSEDRSPGVPYPLIDLLPDAFPEMERVAPVFHTEALVQTTTTPPRRFQEEHVMFATGAFFQTFDHQVLAGTVTAIDAPGHVLLTASLARKLFPDGDAVGKTVQFDGDAPLTVGAVLADPPPTSLPFTVVVSYQDLRAYVARYYPPEQFLSWGQLSSNLQVYVRLQEGADPRAVETRLAELNRQHRTQRSDGEVNLLQPLAEIHFDPRYDGFAPTVPPTLLVTLTTAALFLVLLACVNFINTATAQATRRGREVGIRKVLGSRRAELVGQFLGETAMIVLAALLLAVGVVQLVLPAFSAFVEAPLSLASFANGRLAALLLVLAVTVTLTAGLYPALLLSSYQPARALRGGGTGLRPHGLSVRQLLVGFQFVVAQGLLIGTLVVWGQTRFLQRSEMGFTREAVLTVPLPDRNGSQLSSLRQQLLQQSGVEEVSFSNVPPASQSGWFSNFGLDGQPDADFPARLFMADNHFTAAYGLSVVAGRALQPSDTLREFMINETMARRLGFTDPAQALGRELRLGSQAPRPVVGVVADFHAGSLREPIDALLLFVNPRDYFFAGIRLRSNAPISSTLPNIEREWKATFPGQIFSYEFMDDAIAGFYVLEEKLTYLFGLFAGVAIFIGCMGLHGLVTFVVARRTQEIGVRKVLGASVGSVTWLVLRAFGRIVLLSSLIAMPLTWYFLWHWLADFAYRIQLHVGYFVAGGLLTAVVVGLSVGAQSLRAARMNPVRALRND